jgi:hypothetical protein
MRRIHVLLLLLAFAVQPTAAAGVKEGPPGTNVEMPYLIAPLSKDGKLLGYAYISSKMVTSSPSAAIDVREKLAFIQDAFVRDVNGEPIGEAGDPTADDRDVLNDRMAAVARRIVGNDKVVGMVFIAVQYAPLHPGDTTLNQVPPAQAGAAAPPAQDQNKSQTAATSNPAPDAIH